MSDALLELRGVSKTYRIRGAGGSHDLAAVTDLDLSVAPGEIVALVGESGAGKSTVARLILGMERAEKGDIIFEGQELSRARERTLRRARRRMHLVFQDPYQSLHPGMRVSDLVAEPLVINGVRGSVVLDRVVQALEEVELSPAAQYLRRYPHELSGGQRQRVALARALVGRPQLLLADEPTSMLDVSVQAGVLDLVLKIRGTHGVGIVFITHDLAVARQVSDRIGVMFRGRLVELAPTHDLVERPVHPYTSSLLAAASSLALPPAPRPGTAPTDSGCHYYGRCPLAEALCAVTEPVLRPVGPRRRAACHLAAPEEAQPTPSPNSDRATN